MGRTRRLSYKELIEKNKIELFNDQAALNRLEEKLDKKLAEKIK